VRIFLGILVALATLGCPRELPMETREPSPGAISVIAAPPQERIQAGEAKRGVGWYPDVEVDAQDRVHVAYTDADVGDVLYAASAAGATTPGTPSVVESKGAAGAFVRLALTAAGEPVISYYHQDEHTLKVARSSKTSWTLEEIAFGDEAGAGSALVVDAQDNVHIAYYVKGDRLRYAKRNASGAWEKLDVDRVGPSPLLITDIETLDDGTVFLSYCDWQVVMAHHKMAMRAPGTIPFKVIPSLEEPKAGIEGASSAIFKRDDGLLDVAAVSIDSGSVLVGRIDPKNPAPFSERERVARVHGPAVMKRGKDGTLWILTRDPREQAKQSRGLFLVEIPGGDVTKSRRWFLERGPQDDAWIDLALRVDGRPVAVWFSEESKALKIYAP
jgi:hypothetical protein